MKQTLLLVAVSACALHVNAQKKINAFAITAQQKGQTGWTEVRVVDVATGEEVQSVYKSSATVDILNARTGKPVQKRSITDQTANNIGIRELRVEGVPQALVYQRKIADNLHATQKNDNLNTPNTNADNHLNTTTNINQAKTVTKVIAVRSTGSRIPGDHPFATSSAALAYDRKHERLYYTPMSIAQLRYIDLKTGKVFYFEDEAFGVVQGRGDSRNQITRMVFASDGHGYALTNDANHLIRFTTGKKPEITDLGPLTDNASNGSYSVHHNARFGGDMIADANRNLYLIGADRTVFKISLESRVANYLGKIKGLPNGFSTNGAVAEGGSSVIVSSSNSTAGYYRFDLLSLQAEKVSDEGPVFNASDLANGILAFEKTKKKDRKYEPVSELLVDEPVKKENTVAQNTTRKPGVIHSGSISVYPNPVTTGTVKISFADHVPGKYQIQLLDIAGRIVTTKQVAINNKVQVEEFNLPAKIANGSYLIKVMNSGNNTSFSNKIVVQ